MSENSRLQNLLTRYLNNSCTQEEFDELFRILKSAENEPQIKQMLGEVWDKILKEDYDTEAGAAGRQQWFEEIYAHAQRREAAASGKFEAVPGRAGAIASKKIRPILRKRRGMQWVNIAALLLLSVLLSIAYYFYNTHSAPQLQEVVYNEKTAAPGEKVRFILSDGTMVHLNSGSRLEYPEQFSEHAREVKLDGEAFFEVARDTTRPFLVHSDEIITKVLGTSFNVRSYPGEKEAIVAVASGKVAVLESGSDISEENYGAVLQANQWTNYNAADDLFETNSGDISLFTAWNHDVLYYMDDALEDVARKFELWYGVQIEFKNDAIKNCTVRGEHRGETLVNILESITYAFVDMEYEISGRNVVLSGRGCK